MFCDIMEGVTKAVMCYSYTQLPKRQIIHVSSLTVNNLFILFQSQFVYIPKNQNVVVTFIFD